MGKFQACAFLFSNHGHAVSEERELEENVYSNGDYVETPFLFEQVPCNMPYHPHIFHLQKCKLLLDFFNFILSCCKRTIIICLFYRK